MGDLVEHIQDYEAALKDANRDKAAIAAIVTEALPGGRGEGVVAPREAEQARVPLAQRLGEGE